MKVTLITGASGGIGEAIAYKFASIKHNLLLVARNEQKLKALCDELMEKYQIEAQYIVADLGTAEAPKTVFDECQRRGIQVNVLINNAGMGTTGEFYKNSLQAELNMMALNNSAMVSLSHLFLPEMIKNKSGNIINVSSMAGFFPSAFMAVYSASKSFVRTFTQSLTEECRPYNVKVMLFSPGLTSSGFMNSKEMNNDMGKASSNSASAQTPEEVAGEMLEAFEKGKTYHISGGRNRMMIKIMSLFSQARLARNSAKSKRKLMSH